MHVLNQFEVSTEGKEWSGWNSKFEIGEKK